MSRPTGTEMSVAMPVMSSVPMIACSAPPPSPTTLRIDSEKNWRSKRARPFDEHREEQRDERQQRDDERGDDERGDEAVHREPVPLDEVRDDEDEHVEQHGAEEQGRGDVEVGLAAR